MIRPIRSHSGVRVSRQNSRLLLQLAAALRTHSTRKVLLEEFFSLKKVKNISEMEWNSFVCFTVDKENGREPAKQQQKGKNRTKRKLLLCFLSELLCLSFKLKLILKPAILLKFTYFQLCIENKQLRLLMVLGLPHILTVIHVFITVFTKSWYSIYVVLGPRKSAMPLGRDFSENDKIFRREKNTLNNNISWCPD